MGLCIIEHEHKYEDEQPIPRTISENVEVTNLARQPWSRSFSSYCYNKSDQQRMHPQGDFENNEVCILKSFVQKLPTAVFWHVLW